MRSKLAFRLNGRVPFICAAVILMGLGVDWAAGGFAWRAVRDIAQVKLSWVASFVLLGMGTASPGRMTKGLPSFLAAATSLVCITQLILLTGGPTSPYFVSLIAVPLVLSMFTPDSRVPTFAAIVAMLGTMVGVNLLSGVAPSTFLPTTIFYGGIGLLGLYAGITYRGLRAAEQVAQEERLQALERLAESERLRRQAEGERADMERLMVMGRLAARVAHEVNNPLAFVKSNLHYLEHALTTPDTLPDVAELRELLDETRQGVLRIQHIIADLRHASREGEGEGRGDEGSPRVAMEEARRLALSRLSSRSEVVLDVTEELPPVRLGQRHLMQVLLNLLLNAAQAVEEFEPRRPARILLRARRTAGDVQLEVEDNGPGIPQELLPRLFDPFHSPASRRETGLGLALCREYVVRVGGTLTAENRPEGGARFILTLHPAHAPA